MFSQTRCSACIGKELYSRASTLPRDFYEACANHFGIKMHQETFIGVRSSQIRGLFLSPSINKPLEANKPIATIPLSSLYTVTNIHTKPDTLHHVTLSNVRDAIRDVEFKAMTSQFYLGLQMSAIISSLPDITRAQNAEEMERITQILRGGAMPWARLIDDEDFNEQFVFGMYGMALDSWQRQSYEEMTKVFHRNITSIHEKTNPPFSVDTFRRITRLILARAEHFPPLEYYNGSVLWRRVLRFMRRWSKIPEPSELCLVPLLDLVNHSNRPNCAIRIGPSAAMDGRPAVTIYSIARINPGQEICRHYNFAINRPNALFRYGFLPFDLISIVEHDAIDEYLVKNQHMLREETEEAQIKRAKERAELQRLEQIFQKARSGSAPADS
ncbi:SET domain containing protein [Trypanosoma brucei equiperdum]|uniref:SET domain containing protein n=1 Tax=Trypanosoma brucei equiperdum TaxID=630700 RepID=A0A3L6L808_9TRYP|nr:SET domain containing protein [Trypanosoma brucei equiperdum]